MLVNYYVVPVEEKIQLQMSIFMEMWEKVAWQGKWLWLGDFNETFDESWAATMCLMQYGWLADYGSTVATRWSGSRVIDLIMTNTVVKPIRTLDEKISDHKIIETGFEVTSRAEEEQLRFVSMATFVRPSWTSPTESEWQCLF